MKILLTRNTVINGQHCDQGSVIDADPQVASQLIRMGKATAIGAAKEAKKPETATMPAPEREALVDLAGKYSSKALAKAGVTTIEDLLAAIDDGLDLTKIKGIGRKSAAKILERLAAYGETPKAEGPAEPSAAPAIE